MQSYYQYIFMLLWNRIYYIWAGSAALLNYLPSIYEALDLFPNRGNKPIMEQSKHQSISLPSNFNLVPINQTLLFYVFLILPSCW